MAVPKATMHKDYSAITRQDNVRPTWQVRRVQPVPKAARM